MVHEKGGQTQRFAFEGDNFSVGREDDNDLVLDRVNVSKHHLRFRRHEGRVECLDLDSTNGTYINGRRVTAARIVKRTDRVYVGDYILMLEGDDVSINPPEPPRPPSDAKAKRRREAAKGEVLPDFVELVDDTSGVFTSAQRVPAAGVESTYLDRIANQIVTSVLHSVPRLDPSKSSDIYDDDREQALTEIEAMIADLRDSHQLDTNVEVGPLKERIARELLEYGPLGDLMRDHEVREIQVVGSGPIHVIRETGPAERIDLRFTSERSLQLAIRRIARKRGLLVEGAQVLEGIVEHGFYLYAVLPPHAAKTPVLSLRRIRTDANSLAALVQEQVLSADMRELLALMLRECRRVVVCASGGVNLDRFMRAVVNEIPDTLRVACISDTGRLSHGHRGWVQVRRLKDPSDTIDLSSVLGVLLRGGLDQLVSQQCGQQDAAAVIDAIAGASRGAVVSLWGINAAHALTRLAALGSTMAGGALQPLTVSLAHAIDVVVRLNSGVNAEAMQVLEIIEPHVHADGTIEYRPLFTAGKAGDGTTEFKSTISLSRFLRTLREQGVPMPPRFHKL
ncbi:MAG: Flp pilus assembly complex ATPase component TadA [Myxococcales bacterium]|nr:Flp pilus assembly complex ATPase component TadA [Myxococcales bacterium]